MNPEEPTNEPADKPLSPAEFARYAQEIVTHIRMVFSNFQIHSGGIVSVHSAPGQHFATVRQ